MIIGAGPAGEAAALQGARARRVGRHRRPALVRRQLPAHRLRARRSRCSTARPGTPRTRPPTTGRGRRRGATTWSTAPPDAAEPDDCGHVRGARGGRAPSSTAATARDRRAAAGSRSRHDGDDARARRPRNVVVAVGSRLEGPADRRARRRPDLDEPRGDARPRAAARACSSSVAARPAASSPRSTPGSACRRPSSSPGRASPRPTTRATPTAIRAALERDGVDGPARRPGAPGAGRRRHAMARTSIDLDDGSTGGGPRDPARGRARRSRSTTSGSSTTASTRPAGRRSRATAGCASPTACGSSATRPGPELHTHQGHYQGELAVRMALGEDVVPDYRALPRATYTDPEAASVGVTLDQALRRRARCVRARRRLRDEREGLLRSRRRSGT